MDPILDSLRDAATGPVLVTIAAGLMIALVVWLPLALRRLPLSLPVVCVAIGAAIFSLPHVPPVPSPLDRPHIVERYAEFVVMVALMEAGLKIDRVFGFRRWRITWRLIMVTMPLSILAIALLGGLWLDLHRAAALLLAAALAATAPVMAAEIEVGPPRTGAEDEVRFGLTSEAGLNDAGVFPFVHLAIALSLAASTGEPFLRDWFLEAVLWEIAAGVVCGWLIGRAFGWATFHIPADTKLAQTGDGMIALAATFVSYGVTEAVNGYGFLAVFIAALAFRDAHRSHDFQRDMHDVTEQVERVAMMVLLIFFGGALAGGLLAPLRPVDVAGVLVILLVIRPLAGLAGLAGLPLAPSERWVIAIFGIRGVGSIYYLAYGLNHMQTGEGARLWAITGLVVLCSVLMHGLTVTPIMRWLDRGRGDDPDAPGPHKAV